MKISLVVLSVATLFAHSTMAQSVASSSASASGSASASASASASSSVGSSATASPSTVVLVTPGQEQQIEPVAQQPGQIDLTKIDPYELESIYEEIEEDALLEDMVKNGWPEPQAQMVLSLSDIVESLTQVPEEDENNEQVVASFAAVRETMRDLLASAGLEFHNADDGEGRALSRMTTTNKAYSPKNVVSVVHGLVNLMRTASKFTAMLGNPSFSQYGMMISSAVQMIENLMGSAKGMLSPDLVTVSASPQ